ncbi:MAG: hypothetical protein K9G61_07510, partial [Bacteroidales bacterium]|nr:hypothetical protein [Bacteroidales bacterium]
LHPRYKRGRELAQKKALTNKGFGCDGLTLNAPRNKFRGYRVGRAYGTWVCCNFSKVQNFGKVVIIPPNTQQTSPFP